MTYKPLKKETTLSSFKNLFKERIKNEIIDLKLPHNTYIYRFEYLNFDNSEHSSVNNQMSTLWAFIDKIKCEMSLLKKEIMFYICIYKERKKCLYENGEDF